MFAGMLVLTALYAGTSASRLLVSGVLVDAVMVHFGGPEGDFLGRVDAIWQGLSPDSTATLSGQLDEPSFFQQFLFVMLIVFTVLAVAMALSTYFKEYLAQLLIVKMIVHIRKALFCHLAGQSVAYFNRQRSGDMISRLTNDVNAIQLSFRFIFEDIIQAPIRILSSLAVAFLAAPVLALVTVPFYGLLMLPILRSGRKVRKHGRGRLQKLGIITEAIEQLFGGIRIVKAFGMERHEQQGFEQKNTEFIRATMKMNRAKVKARSLQELFYNLGTAGLLLLGILAITYKIVEASSFLVFLMALVQVYAPLKSISRGWNQIQESRGGVERVLEILRERPSIQDRDTAVTFPGLREEIRFEDVCFSYDELDPDIEIPSDREVRLPVIRNVSFSLGAGQVMGLVGPSGAGKSTVVDLVARFYDPQGGRVLVDGRDIREYRYTSYLEAIAIVSQEPFLFNTTIRENIRYGRESATDEEVEQAARIANAHGFIMEQPHGYETRIGDRGVLLSGGQRQRITIARAVLKNAQILIFDEATSSLDSEAEKEVQSAIENLMKERTSFVIAHRLSTIRRADKILVMDEGDVVESGRHEELLERRGRYYELWRAQNPET